MVNATYLILVLAVGLYSLAIGFRNGVTYRLASLLGFAFGAVSARLFTAEMREHFEWAAGFSQAPEFQDFTVELVCAIAVYTVVYAVFASLSIVFRRAMSVVRVGMFNRLTGAFFCLVRNLLWLSMGLNLLLCLSPKSRLLGYEQANDGNLVGAVMDMTHAILGCGGAREFAHFNQLKEAKTISCNYREGKSVILSEEFVNFSEDLII